MGSSLSHTVSSQRLLDHLRALEGERHPWTSPKQLQTAVDYVVDQFQRAGLAIALDEFSYMGERFVNVIARHPKALDVPRLIVGAHVDTVPGTPGADDNASGVAVMLETAQSIAAALPQAPVEFAGFNLEEFSMVGSSHYASALKRNRTSILGMVSLEMVGFTESQGLQRYPPFLKRFYPSVGNFIGLIANRRSQGFLTHFVNAMRRVPDLPIETVVLTANGWMIPESRLSDHSPFWDAGYPALLITDTAFLRNPHYHQPTDTIETLDLPFITRVCQGLVEAIAALTASMRSTMA